MADPLVTTRWLDQHLDDPDLRLIDLRGRVLPASAPPPHYQSNHAAYDELHIPGAVFVDWVTDITVDGPAQMQVALPEKFAALMRRLGVGAGTQVVVYDDAASMLAARLWWALHYYGHERVAVLDGGWHKWLDEDRPVTDEVPQITPTQFVPRINPALRHTAADVQALLGTDARLIDVRTPAEFAGQESRAARAGHIPGALNLPRADLISPDGLLLPVGVLQDKFVATGVQPGDEVVLYCNSGVSASYGLLALRAAGMDGAVYDGSWKDWGNDPSRPIA